jgi:dTDP-4-dehydrorhamnose reductase
MLAADIRPALEARGFEVVSVGRTDCDVTQPAMVRSTVERIAPGLVLNCAAYTHVDRAETEVAAARAVNADGAGHVAQAVARIGAKLVHISTDYVFDGTLRRPYRETDTPAPLGVYARSKLEGELRVLSSGGNATVVRTGELYGSGGPNFFAAIIARARAGGRVRVVDDQVVSPTWTRELARQIALLVDGAPPGLYHATADGETTWYQAACAAFSALGIDVVVEPISTQSWGSPTPRTLYSVLAHQALDDLGLYRMRTWRDALHEWLLDSTWRSA